ncbi:MAG TPA: DUF5946 family protein [Pyrinomonadaceae bacterium]|jgi:hypothetical protein|nr:DUF5946 family protein [Pyrinomonadaceae bacterium]
MKATIAEDVCGSCGAAAEGGKAGCLKLFEEVIAREFEDYRYGRVHRLTVDAYSLQHPDEYMRSGKSFAAHLTGMCAALEGEDVETVQDVNRTVQKWLSTNPKIEKPAVPERRGTLTVAHVHAAADADEHVGRVREWARDAWGAWAEHHEFARRLIAEATAHAGKV